MGRSPCCDKSGLKKGPWTPEEDEKLIQYIQLHGPANWRTLPKNAGLQRCGKSCRLRWANYLRPDIKRGRFSFEEEETIIQLHSILGNKWSAIAARLPGRTDNEIKNYWNTHIRKRLLRSGIDPVTHSPRLDLFDQYVSNAIASSSSPLQLNSNISNLLGLQAILNPELLNLLGTMISPQQQQQQQQNNPPSSETTQLIQADQLLFDTGLNNQTQLMHPANSSQFLNSSQTSPDNSVSTTATAAPPLGFTDQQQMTAAEFEYYWLNNNSMNQNFTADSLGSMPWSSPITPLNSDDHYQENSNNMVKFEIPEGSLDINDFM